MLREVWDILGGQPGGSIKLCNVRTFLLAVLGIHLELDNEGEIYRVRGMLGKFNYHNREIHFSKYDEAIIR